MGAMWEPLGTLRATVNLPGKHRTPIDTGVTTVMESLLALVLLLSSRANPVGCDISRGDRVAGREPVLGTA